MDQKYLSEIKAREQDAECGEIGAIADSQHDVKSLIAEVGRLTAENAGLRANSMIQEQIISGQRDPLRDGEIARLIMTSTAKDQQIDTLKKALEYACADRATTPSMWQDLQKKYMEIAHQAQESISRRYIARTVVGGNMNAKSGSAIKMIFGVKTVP